ncbi:unnamed protein product [Paramecium pentaurelia]|uniref:Uncharacterized protein n=1 Tax=Paramecium pentaurelia TaxID=43138 RepID=A0A8S1WJ13_9CILI|nr:unnamed protein product [Paramecium pentaurelia]
MKLLVIIFIVIFINSAYTGANCVQAFQKFRLVHNIFLNEQMNLEIVLKRHKILKLINELNMHMMILIIVCEITKMPEPLMSVKLGIVLKRI